TRIGEIERLAGNSGHLGKTLAVFSPIDEVSGCDHVATAARRLLPKHHELIWISVWQRAKQHGIHHAEDRGVRTDSQRERKYGRGRETGTLQEHAYSVSQVLKESVHR